jgi:hypothetical protein
MGRTLFEHKHPPHVDVRVLELVESPAETNARQVFYASVLAFCDAIALHFQKTERSNLLRGGVRGHVGGNWKWV